MSDTADDQRPSANSTPRSAHQLMGDALGLYRRHSLFFFVLAAGMLVLIQLPIFAVPRSGPTENFLGLSFPALSSLDEYDFGIELFIRIMSTWLLINPLIAALLVRAVDETRGGRNPRLGPPSVRGLRMLLTVLAAWIMSVLAITLGFILFVVPGLFLMLRWYVVVQAAAMEHEGWLSALRRSYQLTAGSFVHVLVFATYVGVIVFVPLLLIGLNIGHHSATVASVLVVLVVQVVTWSFGALATALLYFDLRLRHELSEVQEFAEDPLAGK